MANANISQNFNLIIPAGTQIVTKIEVKNPATNQSWKPGAVGVIVQSPTDNSHAYLVKLPDGTEISLRRHEFSIRKQFQSEGLQSGGDFLAEYNLYDSVIYRCIVGSRAYGLDNEQSDTDRRGIYQPPAMLHWSLYGIPEQLENKQNDECYWELQKFLIVALKANPNVLECLYTPLVETVSPIAQELLDIREIFLSKLVYQTYNGYVLSQFKKMEQDLRNTGEVRSKHAMHLIRLLLSGITVLKEGFVPVRVDDYRSQLLSIRNQEVPWDEVNRWRLDLHREFDRAFGSTRLPERPDYEKANQFLIKARRSAIED
ncbi:MAG: nucleotidyltransferase domain-containing protein [Oscillatoriales cyanobacterium]|uniref:Nucleotidyltransferase domain-containing protein n=1 Tax=Microcoleus anatoxicus PTRS2 TaxID=2705321 RepID=A0ABU8YTI3_9CYAN|nr:MAG: nucleotidyltransferase domain-containing protein [Oscillatoriales cyanobacterium]TAE05349.1 MAG: nucleotidyltransferase domain-containing protein [Oscillatoriales cyanobacterium]TAF02253.1 MAG: nucleotidyltransferase domain-containing protein [Oscillatoriales cyanobacterium]TAF30213.1 MAG: nucleotidyltransferase domain-containing protein [Oscillatoriales cyanobacterium]TAF67611.1 MAG: nucleotidyltransferase domain-containing protein [Oscillatoriales cyanobacterium]